MLITQSLCHFLHHELSECHRLLAVLESQMSQSVPYPEGQEKSEPKPEGETGLTLLRLGLWTEDIKLKMRLMAAVVDDAKSEDGYWALPLTGSFAWRCSCVQNPRAHPTW
jgi:gamma-tubulin complex component 3